MTLGDFISSVLALAIKQQWATLDNYLAVIREWQKANPADNLSDLTEVKAEIKALRDLITTNHQEAILANEALAAKLNAKIDEVTAKYDEVAKAIVKEIEQLVEAGTGGSGEGLSAEQVDAAVVRLSALADKMQVSLDAANADDPPV